MRTVFLVLLGLSLPVAAGAQQPTAPDPGSMVLQPGDVVRVEVWREKDLSGAFLIDETGSVTLPLLGRRKVAGTPIDVVRDTLVAEYQAQLRNPSVTITPLRRVYVLGEVNVPGLYQVDPTVSLAGAIALAGGANAQGDLRSLRVVRNGEVIMEGVQAERALASADIRSGDQIFVNRRNWFERNSTFLVSALISVTSIIVSLTR